MKRWAGAVYKLHRVALLSHKVWHVTVVCCPFFSELVFACPILVNCRVLLSHSFLICHTYYRWLLHAQSTSKISIQSLRTTLQESYSKVGCRTLITCHYHVGNLHDLAIWDTGKFSDWTVARGSFTALAYFPNHSSYDREWVEQMCWNHFVHFRILVNSFVSPYMAKINLARVWLMKSLVKISRVIFISCWGALEHGDQVVGDDLESYLS